MKVLLVWPYFYPKPSAAAVRGCAFARYLQELNVDVEVIAPVNKLKKMKDIYSPNEKNSPIIIHRIPLFMESKDVFNLPESMTMLRNLIKDINPDLIISSSTPSSITWQVANVTRFGRIPLIIDVRDPYASSLKVGNFKPLFHKMAEYLEKYSLKNADLIFSVTKKLKEFFISAYNINDDKIKIVPNGWIKEDNNKIEQIKFRSDIIHIGSLGDIADEMDSIIFASKKIIKDNPNVTIAFLGCQNKDSIYRLKQISEKNMIIIPPVAHNKVFSYLNNSKIGIMTLANSEIFKTTINAKIYEYLGSELPIVAMGPPNGELQNFIESNNIGLYSTNKNDFVENIQKILSDEELWEKIHSNSSNIKSIYNRRKIVQDAFRLYIKPLIESKVS
jgi:glycosyltransferase involved in cell wall biosynthesis